MPPDETPKIDPALAKRLEGEDLSKLLLRGTGYAVTKGNKPIDAEDLAAEVLHDIVTGAIPLGPDDVLVEVYLDTIYSRSGNALKKKRRRREVQEDETIPASSATPLQHFAKVDAERGADAIERQLREEFADDRIVLGVMDLGEQGIRKPRDQAKALGAPIEKVYAARDKIRKRIDELAPKSERTPQ